ncbi:hypothetical protein UlMin_036170 [Ulmus minor]
MGMMSDLFLQAAMILISIFMFLYMHDVPKKLMAKFRFRNRPQTQAKRHFVIGAQLLARARSIKSRSAASNLAKEAVEEADKAVALDPKDAAAHILKALALDLQGFKTSALDSLDAALSPLAIKSLSEKEKGDALFKRAELKIAIGRHGKVDAALGDLTEAVLLSSDNVKAFCLLGECYELKQMGEEAKKAYDEALKLEPELAVAKEALQRLGSSS